MGRRVQCACVCLTGFRGHQSALPRPVRRLRVPRGVWSRARCMGRARVSMHCLRCCRIAQYRRTVTLTLQRTQRRESQRGHTVGKERERKRFGTGHQFFLLVAAFLLLRRTSPSCRCSAGSGTMGRCVIVVACTAIALACVVASSAPQDGDGVLAPVGWAPHSATASPGPDGWDAAESASAVDGATGPTSATGGVGSTGPAATGLMQGTTGATGATAAPGPCVVSPWGDWSQCTRPCGGGETQRQRAIILQGQDCPHLLEFTACNEHPCRTCCVPYVLRAVRTLVLTRSSQRCPAMSLLGVRGVRAVCDVAAASSTARATCCAPLGTTARARTWKRRRHATRRHAATWSMASCSCPRGIGP